MILHKKIAFGVQCLVSMRISFKSVVNMQVTIDFQSLNKSRSLIFKSCERYKSGASLLRWYFAVDRRKRSKSDRCVDAL